MADNVVIVESPAKAKTIGRFLGSRYKVLSSLGHVRDLPKSKLGVDTDHEFAPSYVIPKEKKQVVKQLKEALRAARSVYLATDPDREGEAISWHLMQAADISPDRARRVVFHEITKDAIADAFRHPRQIDMRLVNAQQARRILDRLVGYKLSPLLWRKVKGRLSAGRVQSVAVRIIVDREREIEAFVPVEYWTVDVELQKRAPGRKLVKQNTFRASFIGRFGEKDKLDLPDEATARSITAALEQARYAVADVRERKTARQPAPPFTTSTLQQEAFRKLRFSASRTMAVAQQLYEGLPIGREGSVGLITYMRTDSVNVAASAQDEAREFIRAQFGDAFVPGQPRVFTKKQKAAQEAHEAIRPTSVPRTPETVKPYLSGEQYRLYELVWKRFLASQMSAAEFDQTSVDIKADAAATAYLVRATGSVLRFAGFLAVYSEGRDDDETEERDRRLPPLAPGEVLDLLRVLPERHETQPPPRYTEATLVKALEERGIGRPSTYAPILSTIQERGYVRREERRLVPTDLGRIVNDLLVEHFPRIVDEDFTVRMEEELDEIAQGEREMVPALLDFYRPFDQALTIANQEMPEVKIADEPSDEVCDECGRPMVFKTGRYGRFLACTGFPECRRTKPILRKIGVPCPLCGAEIVERRTRARNRVFYGCSRYPDCEYTSWSRPLAQRCSNCGGPMILAARGVAKCTRCDQRAAVSDAAVLAEQSA